MSSIDAGTKIASVCTSNTVITHPRHRTFLHVRLGRVRDDQDAVTILALIQLRYSHLSEICPLTRWVQAVGIAADDVLRCGGLTYPAGVGRQGSQLCWHSR